jgi:hypothetical protein
MNKHIKELINEAGLDIVCESGEEELVKFAELIAAKCVDLCREVGKEEFMQECGPEDGARDCESAIEWYFRKPRSES